MLAGSGTIGLEILDDHSWSAVAVRNLRSTRSTAIPTVILHLR